MCISTITIDTCMKASQMIGYRITYSHAILLLVSPKGSEVSSPEKCPRCHIYCSATDNSGCEINPDAQQWRNGSENVVQVHTAILVS